MRRRRPLALAAALLAGACGDASSLPAVPVPAAPPPLPAAPIAAPSPPVLRLPATARPLRYDLDLTVVPSRETFTGTVSIDLQIAEPTTVLWLNATGLALRDARLSAGGPGGVAVPARIVPGGEDFAGFVFDAPVGPGPARITIAYEGPLDQEKSRGLYRQAEGSGPDDWYAYSFFEPIDARRAFPCFDEPGAKVPWKLTLHVKKAHAALSNAPVVSETDEPAGMKAVAFAETRPLPSYLVAIVVGPFDVVAAGEAGHHGTPLRFVVPRGRGGETAYAAAATPRIVGLLEDYFGMPYPYGKLDVAVVPRYWGTMEHPGLLAMGQPLALIRPADRSPRREQRYANIAAHELSHYWFGDYVTMAWWDDTWLNEALATWMDTKLTERFEPAWQVEARRRHDPGVMDADALATAKRIRQPIASKHDIDDAFDSEITYGKGSMVLAMFERFLGAEVFQRGIRRFLRDHAWGSAVADDLYAALSAEAGRDVAPAFKTFVDQPGLPIVSAEAVCGRGAPPRLHLTQRRFVPAGSGAAGGALWQIPVCVKYGAGRTTSRACTLLTTPEADVPLDGAGACPAWVMPNEGAIGYYRAAYRPEALRVLLAKAGAALGVEERASLLDDAAALTRTGALPLGDALALVPRLVKKGVADPLVLARSAALLEAAQGSHLPPPLRAKFAHFVRRVYRGKPGVTFAGGLRPGEPVNDAVARRALLSLLTGPGEDDALGAQARDFVLAWLRDPAKVDPGLVDTALFAATRGNDAALFHGLRAALRSAPSHEEKARLAGALGGFSDPALAREAFALLLGDEIDPRDSMSIVFRAFASPETREGAYALFKQSFDAIARRMRPDEASWLFGVLGVFCDEARVADAAAFFGPRAEAMEGAPRALANSLETIRQCAAAARLNRPSLEAFLKRY